MFDWRLKIMDRSLKNAKIVTLTSYLTTSRGRDHTLTHTQKQTGTHRYRCQYANMQTTPSWQ